MPGAWLILPTYNEADNVEPFVRAALPRLAVAADGEHRLLIVDDSSPDGTAWTVRALQQDNPKIHLVERARRMGLASAYVEGFRWALERDFEAVVEMDADLSHDPADVSRLVDALEGAELSIGSRYVAGGDVVNWGRLRRGLSKLGNIYARLWLGFEVADATSGFRAFRAGTIRVMDLSTVRSDGYAFQIEMVRRVHKAGGTIKEVPIRFVDRTAGRSKMSRRIVLEAVALVTLWGIRDRLPRRRPTTPRPPRRG